MPPKSKPDTSGFEKLKKDLSAGRPDRLYIFHGEETYLRDHYLGRLREAVLTGGLGEFNRHDLSAKDMSPHALEEAVDCLPMMAERTLVEITDFDLFKAVKRRSTSASCPTCPTTAAWSFSTMCWSTSRTPVPSWPRR